KYATTIERTRAMAAYAARSIIGTWPYAGTSRMTNVSTTAPAASAVILSRTGNRTAARRGKKDEVRRILRKVRALEGRGGSKLPGEGGCGQALRELCPIAGAAYFKTSHRWRRHDAGCRE